MNRNAKNTLILSGIAAVAFALPFVTPLSPAFVVVPALLALGVGFLTAAVNRGLADKVVYASMATYLGGCFAASPSLV